MTTNCLSTSVGYTEKATCVRLYVLLLTLLHFGCVSGWVCQNTCGGVPVQYPFGTGTDCGSQLFQNYVNCSHGKLQLYLPTGIYIVQSIDYDNKIMIIQDPHMSTCSAMQPGQSFGLPVGSPFTIASVTIVLLDCSSSSCLYQPNYICDPSASQVCTSLYSCSGITGLGLPVNSPTSTCCVYSNSQLATQPFEINLPLLQCKSYASIYSFGAPNTYTAVSSDNFNAPNTWSYGIALRYAYDVAVYNSNCKICEQTNGICAFNVYGFVCICSQAINTTTHCFGNIYIGHGSVNYNLYHSLWTRVLGGLMLVVVGALL
eukprot:c20841_g2_i1 orf=359-1306(+)